MQSLGSYETTYGSLAGVAISMFWLWITVFLVILGASVNAEAERQTVRDSTVGPEQPMDGGAPSSPTAPRPPRARQGCSVACGRRTSASAAGAATAATVGFGEAAPPGCSRRLSP